MGGTGVGRVRSYPLLLFAGSRCGSPAEDRGRFGGVLVVHVRCFVFMWVDVLIASFFVLGGFGNVFLVLERRETVRLGYPLAPDIRSTCVPDVSFLLDRRDVFTRADDWKGHLVP